MTTKGITITEHPDGYEMDGAKFKGPCLVADYQEHWRSNPEHGEAFANSCFDSIAAAKAAIEEQFGFAHILLSIPVVVARTPAQGMDREG
tara:strand:+ start:313 stop:582 length:270 start_codon:yes stop_codon:yes gene_type:complete